MGKNRIRRWLQSYQPHCKQTEAHDQRKIRKQDLVEGYNPSRLEGDGVDRSLDALKRNSSLGSLVYVGRWITFGTRNMEGFPGKEARAGGLGRILA